LSLDPSARLDEECFLFFDALFSDKAIMGDSQASWVGSQAAIWEKLLGSMRCKKVA